MVQTLSELILADFKGNDIYIYMYTNVCSCFLSYSDSYFPSLVTQWNNLEQPLYICQKTTIKSEHANKPPTYYFTGCRPLNIYWHTRLPHRRNISTADLCPVQFINDACAECL